MGFTLAGVEDIGIFFAGDVEKIMTEIKKDVRREFRLAFGDLGYSEVSAFAATDLVSGVSASASEPYFVLMLQLSPLSGE